MTCALRLKRVFHIDFVFARPPQLSAQELVLALRQREILVRHFDKPRIGEYLRISIGTDAEMDALLQACAELLASPPGSQTADGELL